MNYILLAVALVALPSPAFAYIDPSAGSMFLQMMIAGVVFGGVMLQMLFTGKKSSPVFDQDNSLLPI